MSSPEDPTIIRAPEGTFRRIAAYDGDNYLGNIRTRRRVSTSLANGIEGVDRADWPRQVLISDRPRGRDRLRYWFTINADESVVHVGGERLPRDGRVLPVQSPTLQQLLDEITAAERTQPTLKRRQRS